MVIFKDIKRKECNNDSLGLKYIPSLEPEYSDSSDYIEEIVDGPIHIAKTDGNGQFSNKNVALLRNLIQHFRIRKVLEIGIARKYTFVNSSTHIIFDFKNEDCYYYGIDLNDEGILEYTTYQKNIHLFIGNSGDEKIIEKIKNEAPLDMIHIDGDHSINGFLQDWKYVQYLRKGGFVLAHDTNNHPGPFYFYDAIDEKKFNKVRYFEGNSDNGIAMFQKLF